MSDARPTWSLMVIGVLAATTLFSPPVVIAESETVEQQVDKQTVMQRMRNLFKEVKLDKVPAEQAFKWWRTNSRIPLVINWDQLREDGVSETTPVTIDLEKVPCHQVLRLIMQQVSPNRPMVVEITPWYVEVLTKVAANERLVTRTYRIRDLLWGPNNRLVRSDDDDGRDGPSSRRHAQMDRVEQLLEVIRTSIEPDIWRENGGKASLSYRSGQLIVRAPVYVHNQLEAPEVAKPVPYRKPTADDDAEATHDSDDDAASQSPD